MNGKGSRRRPTNERNYAVNWDEVFKEVDKLDKKEQKVIDLLEAICDKPVIEAPEEDK